MGIAQSLDDIFTSTDEVSSQTQIRFPNPFPHLGNSLHSNLIGLLILRTH